MPGESEERTEAPTPRRRMEARNRGQVARSHDLTAAAILCAAFVGLRLWGTNLWICLQQVIVGVLEDEHSTSIQGLSTYMRATGWELVRVLGPFLLLLFAVGLVVLLGQIGFVFTWEPLIPSLSKLNPISGFGRLFSARSAGSAAINVIKVIAIGLVAYLTIHPWFGAIMGTAALDLTDFVRASSSLIFQLCVRLSVAILILAIIDYAWQRYRSERDLRMTKEEVKDELRSMEGDPQIKRRRRQLQLQSVMRRLRKDVPKADVIVTNPTHLAVAIQYDSDTMSAPKVVAKGADYAAIRIRQIASEFGIPIVERKPLARALYDSVAVGQYIPERFYRAIAEILAYVYELTGQSPVGRPVTSAA
ncbi:MAG: flagellar biosynthesis protein FlhB [Planctomycetes bacterium]|nr:flagellar biosynthesis protein FlhB [Planctomycetota bacterium]MBI3835288.1 flagellar biosynthesis protein FlhB [Planctomycetota bacterium]